MKCCLYSTSVADEANSILPLRNARLPEFLVASRGTTPERSAVFEGKDELLSSIRCRRSHSQCVFAPVVKML